MEIFLVSGFLGAGKTTLIKHLLASDIKGIGKIAVIVNEFGKVGIDGTLLSGRDVDIMELQSGCICCTIKTDFMRAIQEINERVSPDFLVVEPTGVAQPADILDIVFEPPVSEFSRLKSMVTVVDADFFKAREILGTFYENQISCADILILNKIDLVEDAKIRETEALLREMNPRARIISTQHCDVDPSLLFWGPTDDRSFPLHDHPESDHQDGGGFQTFSFEDDRPIEKEKLIQFLDSLPPRIFRCKGWVRFPDASAYLDFTGGRYRFEPIKNPRATALVFVGLNCSDEEILSALNKCLIRDPIDP
jgi:G3E family GTPase